MSRKRLVQRHVVSLSLADSNKIFNLATQHNLTSGQFLTFIIKKYLLQLNEVPKTIDDLITEEEKIDDSERKEISIKDSIDFDFERFDTGDGKATF